MQGDIVFLAYQRSTGKMLFMHGIDKILSKLEQRAKDCREVQEEQMRREEQIKTATNVTDNSVIDHYSKRDWNIDIGYNDDEDYETETQIHYKEHKKGEETTSNSTDPSK